MNALTTAATGGSLANASDVANPFAVAGDGAGSSIFMKFVGQSGDYIYGTEDDEMKHGTQLAADIMNAKYSWQFWWDGEVLETREVRVTDNPRAFEQEPDDFPEDYDDDMSMEEIRKLRKDPNQNFMDGWSCQGIIGLRQLDGDMDEFTLKLNNGVGMKSFQQMLGAYGRVYKMKPGLTPIIELDARKYKSKIKSVGTRYAPSLKIVDWRSEQDMMDAAGEDPAAYEDEDEVIVEEEQAAAEDASPPADEEAPAASGRRGARGGGRRGRNLG